MAGAGGYEIIEVTGRQLNYFCVYCGEFKILNGLLLKGSNRVFDIAARDYAGKRTLTQASMWRTA